MTSFLKRLFGFFAIQAIIAAAVWHYGTRPDPDHYLLAMQDKIEQMDAVDGRRLIFVGGSNVAFGIDSNMFTNFGSYQPINLGLHAGLGLDYPLDVVRKHAKAGDCVVISPEYDLLVNHGTRGNQTLFYLMRQHWPNGVNYLTSDRRESLKEFFDNRALSLVHRSLRRTVAQIAQRGKSKHEIYRRSNFNQFGDMVGHHDLNARRRFTIKPLGEISEDHFRYAIHCLNDFQSFCSENDIRVFVTYPPFPKSALARSESRVDEIHRRLTAECRIPVLGRPEEMGFPAQDFFDSAYHLKREGRVERCKIIRSALRTSLSNPNAVY